MLRTLTIILVVILGLWLTYRTYQKSHKATNQLLVQSNLQWAMLEIGRILGDSLTSPLLPTIRQVADILARRLDAPVVWVGVQKRPDTLLSLLAVAGARQEVAVSSTLNVGADVSEGSVVQAIHSGAVQFQPIRGDVTYRDWQIRDERQLDASLTIPFRSLEGEKGVIVIFLPRGAAYVSINHNLWTRLADDFAVFLERRKNAVDVRRISGYQLAIVDLLRDMLAVTHLSSAYELALSLLTSRAEARSAWIVEWEEEDATFSSCRMVVVRGNGSEDMVRNWCADENAGLPWLREVILNMKQHERVYIQEIREHALLSLWRDREPAMAQWSMVGAWPLYGEKGLKAILFIASTDPAYFSSSLQIFLHQVTEILHIADQQIRNAAEIRRRTLLYQALLDEADAVLKLRAELPLLEETCKRLVESGLFISAWLGRPVESGSQEVLASATSYDSGHFPSGHAITELDYRLLRAAWQTGQLVLQDVESVDAQKNGIHSPALALLPILRDEKLWAVLVVKSRTADHLSADVLGLLQRIVSLLGHGLDELDLKQQLVAEQSHQTWLATHDPLTGLNNRRGLDVYFSQAILRAQRNRTLLATVILDLDDFKPINDTYGHEAGDLLLKAIAKTLQQSIRNTDFLVRLGGDEFVVLLEGLHGMEDLAPVLTNIRSAVEAPVDIGDTCQVAVGCSAGITVFPDDSSGPDALLRHADEALYAAKRNKTSRSQFWVSYAQLSEKSSD